MTYKNYKFREGLLERTKKYSIKLITTLSSLKQTSVSKILVNQAVRSGTSIGSNYREACEAESSKDFVHKIRISKKEAKETIYWLELLIEVNKYAKVKLVDLISETNEFLKIFSSISSKF